MPLSFNERCNSSILNLGKKAWINLPVSIWKVPINFLKPWLVRSLGRVKMSPLSIPVRSCKEKKGAFIQTDWQSFPDRKLQRKTYSLLFDELGSSYYNYCYDIFITTKTCEHCFVTYAFVNNYLEKKQHLHHSFNWHL